VIDEYRIGFDSRLRLGHSGFMGSAVVDEGQEQFLARHARRNYWLYLLLVLISLGGSPFGDMAVFVPTLAIKLKAPSWIVALPTVVDYSVAYLPILLMGWLMGPGVSRTKVYSWSVAAMYLPILVLGAALFAGTSDRVLVIVFCWSVVVYSLAMGVTILPCWDLFARIFPDSRRGKMMGQAGAVGQAATLLTAGVAGWLISTHSPLTFPKNYAAAMLVFSINGLIAAGVIRGLREYVPTIEDETSTFGEYLRGLLTIVRSDHAFTWTLAASMLAMMLAGISPVVLAYAVKYGGFVGDNDKALLVGVKPYVLIPAVLLFGYLAQRFGPARVAGGLAALIACASPVALVVRGKAQLAPMLLVFAGANVWFYALLSAMRCAKSQQMHQYLSIFFTVCMIPGLAPLGLAWMVDRQPVVAMVLIMVIATMAAIGFFVLAGGMSLVALSEGEERRRDALVTSEGGSE
jgi:hypothetical protein